MGAVSGCGGWLDLFKSLDLPATILLNSEVCDHSPSLVEAFKIAGYEIAAHGRTNSESEAGGSMRAMKGRSSRASTIPSDLRSAHRLPAG
jgi:allantoinase